MSGLRNLDGWFFFEGVLDPDHAATEWSPEIPELMITERSSSKNRYQVYPFMDDGVEGTAIFIEVTISITRKRVALTFFSAHKLQDKVEEVAFHEDENKTTTGRCYEDNRVIGSWTQEYTVETTEEELVEWTEGPPEPQGGI